MKRICDENICTGCSACYNICGKRAITITKSKDGFLSPIIDEDKCVDCGACSSVCPAISTVKRNTDTPEVYAGYILDKSIRKKSSSGGMFSAIASAFFNGI